MPAPTTEKPKTSATAPATTATTAPPSAEASNFDTTTRPRRGWAR